MKFIKISIFLRSPELVWSYRKTHGGEFWADFVARLCDALSPATPFEKKNGNVQHAFYLCANEDADHYKELLGSLLGELLNEDEKKLVTASVSSPEESEIASLRDALPEEERTHALFASLGTDAPAKEAPKKPKTRKKAKADEAPKAEGETDKTPAATDNAAALDADEKHPDAPKAGGESGEEDKAPLTLAEHTERLRALKSGLLSRVRGQRHAIDTLVGAFFECELFAAQNEKRKGPLATFLFTGPSGVGKTFLAELCGEYLDRPMLVVDMSEYSDNLSNNKFNGDHGETAVVTGFVRKHPNGIIVFDEVEKAHINTIHLFLQILDAGRLMDHHIKKEVSFRDNIVILTTNAGKSLYEDATVCDLSQTPKSVILDALRTDVNPQTREPFFPECITTRMANGHVILFNHLEPFALMEIVRDELALQARLFEKTTGIKVEYDEKMLSALVLYHGGGVADARTLRGLARSIFVRELEELVMQLYEKDPARVGALKKINVCIDTADSAEIGSLFVSVDTMYVSVFAEGVGEAFNAEGKRRNTVFTSECDPDRFKRAVRGVTDYVLIDPLCGAAEHDRIPNDVEDMDSDGMRMFYYVREFCPEIPVYVLDRTPDEMRSFDTLLARGAKGIIKADPENAEAFGVALEALAFSALINNAVYALGRSGKMLTYNCAQYLSDGDDIILSFEKLQVKSAPSAADGSMMVRKGEGGVRFADLVGCRGAKEALGEYCRALDKPREWALSGKRMPKGVLLYGPPGTGKTMLAKAMANECGAAFFPVSATSFFGSLVGETEKNIRDVFKRARRYAPAIIFVDEVDAIGRRRSGSSSTAHNEDALNTFLAEMDGFATDERRPVFILAATNYEIEGEGGRVLDAAFVRRFDSKILIPLPDTDDRYELLAMALRRHGIHFGEDHEKVLRNMAARTGGMSNADLEMMTAQFVRGLGDGEPDAATYLDAVDAFRFGEVNKMDPDHLRQTAAHEAGHALVCRLCGVTPSFLTVVSRGSFGGFMESAGENKSTYTYDDLMDRVCRSLAGRAAEVLLYGEKAGINTGASSDIEHARYYVRACLGNYAMGNKLYSKFTPEEAEELMKAQYERTEKMLALHRDALEHLTDLLAEKKSLDQTAMEKFFAAEGV